jgi:hypothetical protein
MLNLLQMLEAGACAAFAIANPEHDHLSLPTNSTFSTLS